MKILIIGDLHGRKPKIGSKDFDAIICTGDVSDDRELAKYIKKWFKYLADEDNESISSTDYMIQQVGKKGLKAMEKRSLQGGRRVLKYLNSFGKPVFIVPGNWDDSYGKTKIKDSDKNAYLSVKAYYDVLLGDKMNPKLTRGLKNINDCQYRSHKFAGYNFMGYGLASNSEALSKKKSRLKKEGISKAKFKILQRAHDKVINKLQKIYDKRDKKLPTLFITHNIPNNTKLDVITDKKSYAYKKHLGSTVARKFCVKNKPVLCVGGHIHDHYGRVKIGKTIVVNPGYGVNANVFVELDGKKVKKIRFNKKYKSRHK